MSEPPDLPPAVTRQIAAPSSAGSAGHAAVSAVLGLIFLSMALPFARWAMATLAGRPFETGMVWPDDSSLAGQPVAYFDLELGAAWRDVGLFATAVVLLLDAALYGVIAVRPTLARPLLGLALGSAVLGVLANLAAGAMQVRAGFTGPILTLVGLLVCAITAYAAGQGRGDLRA